MMTFFEYMQQQKDRDDPIGDLARDMNIDAKIFPLSKLPEMEIGQWKSRIKGKTTDNNVIAIFEQAVKEFREVENATDDSPISCE